MTTDFSSTTVHLQDSTPTHLDIGPLSWVMSEIREALSQSDNALSKALDPAAGGDDPSTAIRQPRHICTRRTARCRWLTSTASPSLPKP